MQVGREVVVLVLVVMAMLGVEEVEEVHSYGDILMPVPYQLH